MAPRSKAILDELYTRTREVFRHGGGTRPEVSLTEFHGEPAVLKDYTRSDPWFARLVGPLSVRREARALRRLAGIRGVPRLLATVGNKALVMEYFPGKSTRDRHKHDKLEPEFFEKFYRLVADMHRRGIAHCDLRSRGNILLGPDGDPYIVDFVAHFKRGRWWNPLTRWIFGKFCQADRTAVARLKKKFARELLTPDEKAALARDRKTPLERGARVVGKSIRKLSVLLLTRRRK